MYSVSSIEIHMLVGGLVGLLVTLIALTVIEPYYPTSMIMKAIIADVGFLLGARMLRSQSNIISYLASSGVGAIGVMMGLSVLVGGSTSPLLIDISSINNRSILFIAAAAEHISRFIGRHAKLTPMIWIIFEII